MPVKSRAIYLLEQIVLGCFLQRLGVKRVRFE